MATGKRAPKSARRSAIVKRHSATGPYPVNKPTVGQPMVAIVRRVA